MNLRVKTGPRIACGLIAPTIVAACGGHEQVVRKEPTLHFGPWSHHSTRAFEKYRATDGEDRSIPVAKADRRYVLRFDCSAPDGTIKVASPGGTIATGKCSAKPGQGKGAIEADLGPTAKPLAFAVSVPEGGKWSVAVDLVH